MSSPSWNPGDAVAEAAAGEGLAIRCGGEGDPGIGVQVVDMCGVDEAVHRGVDRRSRAAATVEAIVERGDHLVLAFDARIDVDQRAQSIQPQDRQTAFRERAEVAA